MRVSEAVRHVVGKTEVGLPKFSPEQRQEVLTKARAFVGEIRAVAPEAGIDRATFLSWLPGPDDFSKPDTMARNPHTQHNVRHVGAVLAESIFLTPYVEAIYKDRLPRPLYPNAVAASAASHDLLRSYDIRGSVPASIYKKHGIAIGKKIADGLLYPQLSPEEREATVSAVTYHDVDPRNAADRLPEDELLAIVDRGELVRITHGIGPLAIAGRTLGHVVRSPFEKRMATYDSHYFSGLAEKMQPLSEAVLILSLEGMKKGLSQPEAVLHAVRELGMEKSRQQAAA